MKTNWKRISSRAGGKVDRRSTKVATVYNLDTNPLASLSSVMRVGPSHETE